MQTEKKAPRRLNAVEPNQLTTTGDGQSNNGHARSNGQTQKVSYGNGSAPHEIRPGPITKVIRYSDMKFTQVLQDTVRDNRLSFGARGLLAYILSQGAAGSHYRGRSGKRNLA